MNTEAIGPTPDRFSLQGKVAIVSGAARGLGQATALALAEHGADLVLVDLDADGLASTGEQIRRWARQTLEVVCDIANPDAIRTVFAAVDNAFSSVDFLANVAGDGILGRPEEISLADVEKVWRNLVYGRFCMCQEAGRRMLRQGSGSIVNIGSIASLTALGRGHIAYSMAMGAVVQMTRELSTEWSSRGIRVNCVLPAQVLNAGLEQRMAAARELRQQFLSGIPTGRFGQPGDLQGLMVLLASDASAWITGAIIPLDGGNLAMNAGGTPGQ